MNIRNPSGLPFWQLVFFIGLFALMEQGWSWLRPGVAGQFFIEGLTVPASVVAINLLTPAVEAHASGTHIAASGGGINIVKGCEGVEVMCLLIAAMAIAPLAWRAKLAGMGTGIVLVFLLNQFRLIAMFYAARNDRALFDMLHGLVAPLILIALTGLFFTWWLGRYADRSDAHESIA